MNINLREEIVERYELLLRLQESVEAKLDSFPNGRIKIKHIGNQTYYYFQNEESVEKLIAKGESDYIEKLVQKSYFKKVLSATRKEKAFLRGTIDNYPEVLPEDVYNKLSEDRKKLVRPIVLTDEQYISEWQNKPYTPKPFKDGESYLETLRGERVRSKSEVIIADRLYANGIPYKYECPLLLGKDRIYPDFTLLRVSDRKILYLEHNGKVGDQVYGDDMVDRLNKYTMAGIHQGDRLFLTFESGNRPLDVRVVDKMISDLFK